MYTWNLRGKPVVDFGKSLLLIASLPRRRIVHLGFARTTRATIVPRIIDISAAGDWGIVGSCVARIVRKAVLKGRITRRYRCTSREVTICRGTSWGGKRKKGTSWDGTNFRGTNRSGERWEGISWVGVIWEGISWEGVSWEGTTLRDPTWIGTVHRRSFVECVGVVLFHFRHCLEVLFIQR